MEQAISKQSMAPLCEPIYTLRAMMEPIRWQTLSLLFSSSSYRYCAVLLLFRFVQAFLLKLYHRRKLNYQIWDMDKRS